ncbi:hypothetical protein DENSPDRAFT_841978 [Dentipellis sp. KUC8613]|nr:hypothetical protein DENSPDRAFT_841978 [Dentipellis sp. KUC8613]
MTQINDIPLELLLWVFWWYTVTSADAPLTISSVCHTWRTLAQRTPELWTRLDLRFVREPNAQRADHSEERAMTKTRAWLKHSMTSPLDVCVTIAHAHEPQVPGFTFLPLLAPAPPPIKSTLQDSPLALLLSAHLPRIGALAVHAPAEADAREFMISLFAAPAARDAALRSLQLSVTGDSAPAPASTQVEARTTQISPQVRDVHLSNLAVPSPWLTVAALTTLTLTRRLSAPPLATTHVLDLLELSANLQRLELHARIRERPTDASLQPARHLTLPHLHTLALTANNLTDLLLPLRVPALADLALSDLDGYAPWTGRGLRAFLTTRPPLRELRLERLLALDDGTWEWCLPRLPQLRSLQMVYCAQADVVLSVLAGRGGPAHAGTSADGDAGGVVCAELRSLALRRCPGVLASVAPWFTASRKDVEVEIVDHGEVRGVGAESWSWSCDTPRSFDTFLRQESGYLCSLKN